MSSYVLSKYNGVPPIFNSSDFDLVEIIADTIVANEITSGLITNTSSLTSNSVVSNAVSIQNTDGTSSSAITETELNQTISQITGGSLNNSLSTLLAIDQAINNDPNFYTDITASIATVQTNVNNNTSLITALQNRATTDETNITNLQNTKLNVSNPNYTGTMYGTNLNLTGTFTTSGNINVNGVSVSPAQISYLGNVTSDIQNQINSKASTSSPIFTGTLTSQSITDNGSLICNNGINVTSGTVSFPNNSISQNAINGLSSNLTTANLIVSTGLTSASIVDNGSLTCNNGINVTSGTVSFPNNSISQNAINNLSSTLSNLAPLASPSLTGNPTVPTQTTSDSSTKIASTAYVQNNLLAYETVANFNSTISTLATKSNPTFLGTVILPSITDNGNVTFNGTTTFTQNLIANSTNITPTQLSYISGLTSNAQTQITNNTNNITNNTNSITSINTNLAGKQNTLTFDSSPTLNSTNIVNSNGIYNALQNYETSSALTTTLSSYLTNSSASSTYLTQSNANSTYLTQSNAISTYAPINNSSLTGITTVNEVSEQINSVSGITTSLSLSYTSCKGINYIQTPTSNFSLTLTNIPTSSTNASYTISLLIPSKYYCNSINVNGSSITIIAGGGLSNISINSSSTMVLQQLSILFLNSTTPTVITNVLSLF